MTREEICNSMTLQDAIQVFRDTNAYGTMDIAKTVILKALEQQSDGDCISRKAALDGLASIAKVKAKSDAQKSLMGRIMFFVEQLPPATTQAKVNILDEIKTEIERRCCITVGEEPAMTLYDIFQIIDKYKTESEAEE